MKKNQFLSKITPREKEVLQLIAQGYSTKRIAETLFLSESTIVTHRETIKKKLNANNCANLVFVTSQIGYI